MKHEELVENMDPKRGRKDALVQPGSKMDSLNQEGCVNVYPEVQIEMKVGLKILFDGEIDEGDSDTEGCNKTVVGDNGIVCEKLQAGEKNVVCEEIEDGENIEVRGIIELKELSAVKGETEERDSLTFSHNIEDGQLMKTLKQTNIEDSSTFDPIFGTEVENIHQDLLVKQENETDTEPDDNNSECF